MAINYIPWQDRVIITGYSEIMPCNYTDLYNADKAGTLSLHPRVGVTGIDGANVVVTTALRPTNYVILGSSNNDLYIEVTNWNGTSASILLTGTDISDVAQTETIVITGNGTYQTTKYYKTLTHTRVTGFTATTLDYDLVQGQWGLFWFDGNQFKQDIATIWVGDGSITTWFADMNKQIFTDVNMPILCKENANCEFGEIADLTKKLGKNGCVFNLPDEGYIQGVDNDTSKLYFYDCMINGAIRTRAERIWQSSVGMLHSLQNGNIFQSNIRNTKSSVGDLILSPLEGVFFDELLVYGGNRGITANGNGVTLELKNTKIYNVTTDINLYIFGMSSVSVLNCINVDCDWNLNWFFSTNGIVNRKYEFDFRLEDDNGNPIVGAKLYLSDQYGTQALSDPESGEDYALTDATGAIVTQTVTYGYYNSIGGSVMYEYSPHNLTIKHYDHTTYVATMDIAAPIDYVLTLSDDPWVTKNETQAGNIGGTCTP